MAEVEKVGALVTSKPSTARPKRPATYRDGENTWTVPGRMPAWAKLKDDAWRAIQALISFLPKDVREPIEYAREFYVRDVSKPTDAKLLISQKTERV
ncbi:hypothetical protein [Bradyrhizobium cajani]|uniref:Uncharacterized protein n=1 Tax=Bradyrhizobium cajani TaxID=1928661 RepID=A0A844TR11_9BRAD|nr:hypothetical protein [Bradyrhizobium cajani]MCP3372777.1 H-NS histone family protein [Bradyrhizobium cajani]MVT78224.1 hypothetical protein [Bradyrhizobium cajani]